MDNKDENMNGSKINSELKENLSNINANSKKRRRESLDVDENVGGKLRRAKLEQDGTRKHSENISQTPVAMIENSEKYRPGNSTLYDYTTKNDVLNLIWKITARKEDFIVNNSSIIFSENFFSKRNDGWYFQIDHENGVKNSGGSMKISIKCVHQNSFIKDDSYLAKIFKNLNFEVEVSFHLLYHKTQNYTIKNLNYNVIESKEIQIPNDFYTSNSNTINSTTRSNKPSERQEDEVIMILEFSIHKNFPSLMNNKEITGFTGIVNEAATCYMNSMLQTLNIFGLFKKAVFEIPSTEEDYHSVALSLQRLFYDLMTDTNPVSTNRLVRSFGWGREQMLIQHDVQEFNILLSDIMEKKMKGTPSEGTFNKLFAGTLNNYIQCVNVDYKSNKEEKFSDLQLTVKGSKDIYHSLNSYTEEEILDNEDKYYAEGYGKQKAKKGIRFLKFPSVLIIQLKRFEYNPKKEAMVKINDYFEYYEDIDLSRYLVKSMTFNENLDDNKYTLHSVVVHQGSANSGHYYAYIRPTLKDFWIQYNDEIVKPADKYEVFKNNYGGNYKTYKHKSKGEIITNTNSYECNAYILVYIKNSERKNILEPVQLVNIPIALRNRFEHEKNEDRKLQLKKMRMTENLNVILITKENIMHLDNQNSRLGIISPFADLDRYPPLIINKSSRLLINFPRSLTFGHFLNFIENETKIPIKSMKLYEYESGDTSIESSIKCRSDYRLIPFDNDGLNKSFQEFSNNFKKHVISLFLYVDESDEFKVLKSNTNKSREEYKLEEKLVQISKEINKFTLNINNYTDKIVLHDNNSDSLFNEYSNDVNNKLLFIKEFNSNNSSFRITKIILINLSTINDYEQLSEKIKNNLELENQSKVHFIIERTCLNDVDDRNYYLGQMNYQHILNKTSSLVVIPILEKESDLIITKLQEMYDTIYVDLYCNNRKSYIKNKLPLNLKNCQDEMNIKRQILKEIKNRNLFKEFIEIKQHYFIDQSKDLQQVNEAFLNQLISEDHIELFQERDSGPRFFQACRETPLLKYLNQADCRVDLNLTLYVKQPNAETYSLNISLFDINNNKICILTVIFPKKVKKCRDIIDYLYDIILTNTEFYQDTFERDEFFFILQNPTEKYIFQILIDNNSEILKYEGMADKIEYRLQPFMKQAIECFQDSDYMKIFIAFVASGVTYNNMIKFEPVTLYVRKEIKLFELKFMITEELNKKRCYQFSVNLNNGLKFYTFVIENNKIKKDMNLQHSKEEETIENILKDYRIYNILTEFVVHFDK